MGSFDEGFLRRFESKVIRGAPGECHMWVGFREPGRDGRPWYGKIKLTRSRANISAHRAAYEIDNGPVPEGMQVLHRCDNPGCVNPAHLEIGTQLKNVLDAHARGRAAHLKGIRNGRARLSEQDVLDIRREFTGSPDHKRVLAARYSVSEATIHDIGRRNTWRHL